MFRNLRFLSILTVMLVSLSLFSWSPALAQTEGRTYTIQADDWLSKLAEKEYGNVLAYKAIAHYTNQKAKTDSAFTIIADPDRIEVGAVIYLPTEAEASAYLTAAGKERQIIKFSIF